jgi:antitoxin (DNA-binding transcriptional repressor) of toxin-antitoxin stability system
LLAGENDHLPIRGSWDFGRFCNVREAAPGKAAGVSATHVRYTLFMSIITVQDLQRDLLGFLQRLEAGESFLVVSNEQPLAEIRPVAAQTVQPRPYGLCVGQFTVPTDFDQLLPDEIVKEFERA